MLVSRVSKPAVDVAGNTYCPMKVSLVEGQTPHVLCTAESTTLIQTQRQESLGLASPSRLSTSKTIIASSSGLYNKNGNTSGRKISTWKGKHVYKGHHLRCQENQMRSRSFELDTRGNVFSEEQVHLSKRRKIDPYTLCGSESQATPGREEEYLDLEPLQPPMSASVSIYQCPKSVEVMIVMLVVILVIQYYGLLCNRCRMDNLLYTPWMCSVCNKCVHPIHKCLNKAVVSKVRNCYCLREIDSSEFYKGTELPR